MAREPASASPGRRPAQAAAGASDPDAAERERARIAAAVAALREDPDPGRALTALVELRRDLDAIEAEQVDAALGAGWSWSRIGAMLGISKQAAHRKHSLRRAQSATATAPSLRPGPASSAQAPADARPQMTITGEARAAVGHARREAAGLGARKVTPEHLLLGAAAIPRGLAARALDAAGIEPTALRSAVAAATGAPDSDEGLDSSAAGRLPITAASRAVFEQSLREALARRDEHLGLEHLLLALLTATSGAIEAVLGRLNVSEAELRDALEREERSAGGRRAA